ncbi:hypothetical protein BGX34_005358 [Mortierella sp. NVP85]|nr:hypothetical protein BGX34_005358 [Mortierella sp. NVP85]
MDKANSQFIKDSGALAVINWNSTTYSCVAIQEGERAKIIANENDNRTTPSYVAFSKNERLVGEAAKYWPFADRTNVIFDVKRLIGRRFDDPEVQSGITNRWPFKVIDKDNSPYIQVDYNGEKKDFSPQEISAMLLTRMKGIVEAKLGKAITKAVITVPAYFNDAQRNATKGAGTIAGLDVLRIIDEPAAAAIAYGLNSKDTNKKVLIFHLGGRTCAATIFSITGGILSVKATAGDIHLGGEDFDNTILEYCKKELMSNHEMDLSESTHTNLLLLDACERVKRVLSSTTETTINALFIQSFDLTFSLSRSRFELLNRHHFNTITELVNKVLKDANYSGQDIDEVFLIGGSAHIPMIRSTLGEILDPAKVHMPLNPDEAVAIGAAILAAELTD